MELNEIKSFIGNIKNNGEFGSKILTATTPSWRATTNNPYVIIRKDGRKVIERIERVVKYTYYNGGAMIGGNYTNQVKTQIVKVDGDVKAWETESMRGTEWIQYPYIMQNIKNNEQKYLRITLRHNAPTPKVVYFLDGRMVTDKAIIEDIKSWLKPHYESTKQAEFGIADENQVRPLNPKIENILYLYHDGQEIGKKEYLKVLNFC